MGMLKAERLLAAMTSAELRELDRMIDRSKRGTLKVLYGLLRKDAGRRSSAVGTRDDLFRTVFDREYSKQKDYLLRNEFRLLTDKIREVLICCERDRELSRDESACDALLLGGLLHRGLFSEFESLVEKYYKQACRRLDFRSAKRILDLYYEYLILYKEISPESMAKAHEVMAENVMNLKRVYRTELAVNQHNRIVCEQNLQVMNRSIEETPVELDLDFSRSDTSFSLFYVCSSLAHQSRGPERIRHANEALEHILEVGEIFGDHAVWGFAILASSYLAEHLYKEARACFESGLEFARTNGRQPPVDMLFNYASTLMKLREYRAALDLMETYDARIRERPKIRFRFECLKCFCHIFLNDPRSALEAIPPAITQRPESEYQYFRFIYLIIPYLNGDLEGALREARNFNDYFNRHKESLLFPKEKVVTLMFKRFFAVEADLVDREEKRRVLSGLRAEIEEFMNRSPEYRDYLYLLWLCDEVEARITMMEPGRRDFKR